MDGRRVCVFLLSLVASTHSLKSSRIQGIRGEGRLRRCGEREQEGGDGKGRTLMVGDGKGASPEFLDVRLNAILVWSGLASFPLILIYIQVYNSYIYSLQSTSSNRSSHHFIPQSVSPSPSPPSLPRDLLSRPRIVRRACSRVGLNRPSTEGISTWTKERCGVRFWLLRRLAGRREGGGGGVYKSTMSVKSVRQDSCCKGKQRTKKNRAEGQWKEKVETYVLSRERSNIPKVGAHR